MTHSAEPVARPQSTLWMLDLGQPLPVGPTPRIPVAFTRAGTEVARELAQAMDLDDQDEPSADTMDPCLMGETLE